MTRQDSPSLETGGSTAVAETGTTDTFTIVLNAQPLSDVVCAISSGDTGETTVNQHPHFHERQLGYATNRDRHRRRRQHHRRDNYFVISIAVIDANSDDVYDSVAMIKLSPL